MSTRKLIIAALICGMAILLAGALQFVQIANDQHKSSSIPTVPRPSPTTLTTR
ncbi:MAG TPA: hypothetical protein VGI06_12695 [Acidimicrobiales bacterium]